MTSFKEVWDLLGDLPGFAALYEVIKEKLKKRFIENPRRDLMEANRLLAKRDQSKADKIMDRLRVAQATNSPTFENNVVIALGEALPRDKDNRLKINEAVDTLEYVADFNDPQFKVFIDAMTNDSVKMLVIWFVDEYGLPGLKWVWGFVSEALRYSGRELKEFAETRILTIFDQPNMAELKKRLSEIRDNLKQQADEERNMNWLRLSWRMLNE